MTAHSIAIRATVTAIAALALLVGQAQANVGNLPSRGEVKRMIVQEAELTQVPPALALALAKVESDFQINALSSAGSRGVMQIMPQTAIDEYGIDPDELWDPRLNIQIGPIGADNYARPSVGEAKVKKWQKPRRKVRAEVRWYPAQRRTERPVVRRTDDRHYDYNDDIEQRRRSNRHRLDDFTAPAPKS